MINFQPRKIPGRWRDGYALDLHTLKSTFVGDDEFGHPRFETERSEIGEQLYKLKFSHNETAVPAIVEALAKFVKDWKVDVDAIVPIPPSNERALQPVIVLATALAGELELPLLECIRKTRDTPQLKNVVDFDERLRLLEGLYEVDELQTSKKRILLFDDLYRSGATMNAITDLLYEKGGASQVLAVAVTRTRSNR